MDEILLVSPIQFRVVVFGTASNATQVRPHGRHSVCLRLSGSQQIPLKRPHSFTHSFDTMREGDTSGIIKGVGGSLQYAPITCSDFGSGSKHIHQCVGYRFAPSVGHEVARPICRFHWSGTRCC